MLDLLDRDRRGGRAANVDSPRKTHAEHSGNSLMDRKRQGWMRRLIHALTDNSLTTILLALFVLFSVFLRQHDPAESKPVESNDEANK